jgi:hypothetical protein
MGSGSHRCSGAGTTATGSGGSGSAAGVSTGASSALADTISGGGSACAVASNGTETINSMQKSSPTRSALAVSGRGNDVECTTSLMAPLVASSWRPALDRICSANASTALTERTADATS